MNTYLTILVGGLLVNNFVMNKFLGICPFLGVSKNLFITKLLTRRPPTRIVR